jgi:glycosyltransferase involved in cell wall biosynthesis
MAWRDYAVVTHVAGEPTPAHHLAEALRQRGRSVRLVALPFHFCGVERAQVDDFEAGALVSSRLGPRRRKGLVAQMASDLLALLLIFGHGPRTRWYVGLDNLNAAAGILLRWLGRVEHVAYYVIDHTPKRFDNPVLNRLYAWVDAFCCRHADYVWVLGTRMEEAKRRRGADSRRLVRTPIGVRLDQLGPIPPQGGRPGSLVVVSHLAKSTGIQLLLEAMPLILQEVPGATLTVIGGGPYEQDLHRLAKTLGLGPAVDFRGFVAEHAQVLRELPGFRVGLAPYLADGGANYSYWADPAKPKEYLAAGLPVVITRVPEIAELIERRPMGLAVDYEKAALAAACVRLLRDEAFHALCRAQALEFARDLAWGTIFERSLVAMGEERGAACK